MDQDPKTQVFSARFLFGALAVLFSALFISPALAGVIPGEGYTIEIFATDVLGPHALAFDSQDNLYIAPGVSTKILIIPAEANIPQEFGEVAVGDADGVAVDSSDNILVSGNPVTKFDPDGNILWDVTVPLGNIQGIGADLEDNAYVGANGGSLIAKISPDGSSMTFQGGFNHPSGPTVGPDGFLYVSQPTPLNIVKAMLDGGIIEVVVSDVLFFPGPAFDAAGDMYFGDRLTETVWKRSLSDGVLSVVASGFPEVQGLAFDSGGSLFVGDSATNIIYMITPLSPPCDPDLDGNMLVNSADLALLLGSWGPVLPGDPADINDDQVVDSADLALLLGSWGACP